MSEVVELHGQPARLEDDLEFISDLHATPKGFFRSKTSRRSTTFPADTWERLGSNEVPIEKIEAEKVRRIRNGSANERRRSN